MRFFRDLSFAVLCTLAVLCAIELALVLAGVKYQGSFFIREPERGYAYRPNARGWSEDEGDNFLTINSDGMADRERPVAHRPGILRIAVIGSSEVAAEQLPREQTFEGEMERQIAVALGRPVASVEVLNFGVAGYNLQQQYLTLHNHVWKYRPDIVLLGTTSMALIRSVPKLFPDSVPGTPFFSCAQLPADTSRSSVPSSSRLRSRLADFINQSRILLAFHEAHSTGLKLLAGYRDKLRLRPANASQPRPLPPTDSVYNPDDPVYADSWKVEDCLVRAMQHDCARHGSEFFLVVFDRGKSISPDPRERLSYARRVGVSSLFLTDERMTERARAEGVQAFDLGPDLLSYVQRRRVALHGFFNTNNNTGHWNAEGNKVAGDLIAARLLQLSEKLRSDLRRRASSHR